MKLDVGEGFNAKVDNNVANAISLTSALVQARNVHIGCQLRIKA